MKKPSIYTLLLGVLLTGAALVLLSIDFIEKSIITTIATTIAGIVTLVAGIMNLKYWYKLMFIYDEEEIDYMKEEELLDILNDIEEEYDNYGHLNPRLKRLYELLGEKIFRIHRKDTEDVDNNGYVMK